MFVAINETAFQEKLDAINTAIDADDIATARKRLAQAEVIAAGLATQLTGPQATITMNRALAGAKASIELLAAAHDPGEFRNATSRTNFRRNW